MAAVQPLRQAAQTDPFEAQPSPVHVPQEQKQEKAACQTRPGGDPPQQRVQRNGQQHGCAQQGEHAPEYQVLRHGEKRHGGHQCPASEGQQTPAKPVAAHLDAVAGEEDEGPADALLPEVGAEGRIPAPVHAEDIRQVPAGVVEHHADEGQPPQSVRSGIAGPSHCAPSSRKSG